MIYLPFGRMPSASKPKKLELTHDARKMIYSPPRENALDAARSNFKL